MFVKSEIDPKQIDAGVALSSTLVSDRQDGLFPTVVVDEQGVALGMVYSSKESVCEAIKQKRGIYHSRTRGLWPKGDTSGAVQDLLRVRVDCDNDCLYFVVHQHGAGFCHKNERTCFGTDPVFGKLVRLLESRKASPQPGSYANRLFTDNALLQAKLREEVEELIAATDKNDVAWETADVIYFSLVAAVKSGVTLSDVEKQLESRSKKVTRRKGDAKPQHTTTTTPVAVSSSPTSSLVASPPSPCFTSLRRISPQEILQQEKLDPVDPEALKIATQILEQIKNDKSEKVLRYYATKFGDIPEGGQLVLSPSELKPYFDSLPLSQQQLLQRSAERVRLFAQAQRDSILDLHTPIEGGIAGHTVAAVERAGCYAPGGRFPLPSSVLMTVITAKVAGVKTVWVCSPKPAKITLAAAYVAGCDAFLQVGGAQAIGAMAYGVGPIPAMDAIVGPGNKYVTAAKAVVSGMVRIDMLAGPSEVLVIADETADPAIIAADLLAQAEHDPDAACILITVNQPDLAAKVDAELVKQLQNLETKSIATLSLLNNSYTVDTTSLKEAITISDKIAPEHLELHLRDAENLINTPQHYGSLFLGNVSAEVLGDYCAGPNHVLPTRGTARYVGGLSVFTFLRVRTWLTVNPDSSSSQLVQDAAHLGQLEGLVGHAAAATIRMNKQWPDTRSDNDRVLSTRVRSDYKSLPPYVPIKPLDVLSEELGIPLSKIVKLDANENVYGPIPDIIKSLAETDVYHIYPDPGQIFLRRALAKHHGVSPSMVVAGSGADDILDLLIRISPPRRPIIQCSPTFGMYSFLGKLDRRQVIDVPRLSPHFDVDIDQVIHTANTTNACVIFLTSPNNPTGNLLNKNDLVKLLQSVSRCIVALDEAYIEFSPIHSAVDLLPKYSNLVILRTFSKWAALAGLRVGYSLSHPQIAACMDTIKQPYNVNVAADTAARKALENESLILKEHVSKLISERDNMYSLLSSYKWLQPYPNSAANFILIKVVPPKPAWLVSYLLRKQGLLIRYYSNPRLIDCIRISIGRPEDTQKVKDILDYVTSMDINKYVHDTTDALIWDFDGCIVDSSGYVTVTLRTLAHFGVTTITNQQILEAKYKGESDYVLIAHSILVEKGVHDISVGVVLSKFWEVYDSMKDSFKLVTNKLLLEQLALKFKNKMAIISDRPTHEVQKLITTYNISSYFTTIITRQEINKPNSEPDAITSAVKHMSAINPIILADNTSIFAAAKHAGVIGVGVLGSDSNDRQLLINSGALLVINNTNDIKNILL
eukprot:TRINITY_DN15071_c0_g1_i1.p1 TRINITY_DN15071_c0_g1~~TRINITY_DN15071_c0_g1_i1.p1  ORF type:complete len:1461 (+),score=305.36 TRINITY_DN15071_c0_g1_i1:570-4385(+)